MVSANIFSIVGVITGSAGMVIGIIGIIHNRFTAVHNFFVSMEDPKFISARHYIYNNTEPFSADYDEMAKNAALIINFFQHWGLLLRKHYLPIWVFDTGTGAGTIRLYERTKSFIVFMRKKNDDPTYADEFEQLYRTLLKRQKRKLKKCSSTRAIKK